MDFLTVAVNPLPHMPILGPPSSSANKDMMSKIWTNGIQLPDWVENVVGKEEIARYEQFLLFPQCFQKLSVFDASKRVSMEWRVAKLKYCWNPKQTWDGPLLCHTENWQIPNKNENVQPTWVGLFADALSPLLSEHGSHYSLSTNGITMR